MDEKFLEDLKNLLPIGNSEQDKKNRDNLF